MTLMSPSSKNNLPGVSLRCLRLSIPDSIENTRDCTTSAIKFLKAYQIGADLLQEFELALMEAVANSVKHRKAEATNELNNRLEIFVSEKTIEFRVQDENEHYGSKITNAFPGVDDIGGRGFPIMETLMDSVDHIKLPTGNLLILIKNVNIPHEVLNYEARAKELEMDSIVEELMSCYESLTAFFKFGALLTESDDHENFVDQLLNRLIQITQSKSGIYRLYIPNENLLKTSWYTGFEKKPENLSSSDKNDPEALCLQKLEDLWTHGSETIELNHGTRLQSQDKNHQLGLVHTLAFRSQTIGTLWLQRESNTPYTAAQINMIHTFCDFLALREINTKHQKELIRIGKVEREMQIARDIQVSLLPLKNEQINRLKIAGICQPAREVGGDYFDHLKLTEDSVLLVIADIMGKGIPASLFVAIFRSLIRSQSHLAERPALLTSKINQLCYEDLSRVGMFLTAQFCFINTKERKMRIANAGHWPLLMTDKSTLKTESIAPDGLPIGVDKEYPFEETEVHLPSQFCLAMYTDGFPEATDAQGKPFGAEGMEKWIKETAENNDAPDDDIQKLLGIVSNFEQDRNVRDDLSVLMVKAI